MMTKAIDTNVTATILPGKKETEYKQRLVGPTGQPTASVELHNDDR